MWLVFAVAFVFGAGILLIQLLSGDGHHGDVGDHAALADHHPHEGPGLLSMRSLSYGLFSFGFVGGLIHILRLMGPAGALGLAAAAGVATAAAVGATFRRLADPSVSGEAALHETIGSLGRVLVPCGSGQRGKVRLSLKGQTVDLLASTDEASIPAGSEVVVLDIRDQVAHVGSVREVDS